MEDLVSSDNLMEVLCGLKYNCRIFSNYKKIIR